MAEPTTTINPVWGVTKTFSGVPGIITDWEENSEAQKDYLHNEFGATIYTKVYDTRISVTCTLVVAADKVTSVPAVGDSATIDGMTYTVISVRLTQNNQSAAKYALTLEAWKTPTKTLTA
jgi:hypothetical protein